jgi:flagellar basal-body rod protein FlgG
MRSLWISKTGLDAQQTQMDVISNNLANASTTGFKRQRAVFEDLLYQNLRQPGARQNEQDQVPSGLQIGTGVKPVSTVRNFKQGNLSNTENPFDVAINGVGFLQIQQQDGSVAYTRDGSLQVNGQGQMVTSNGALVLGPITIPVNAEGVQISEDGIVSVRLQNQPGLQQVGQLQLSRFVNPAGLLSTGQNLYKETAASGVPQQVVAGTDGAGVFLQGYVESSNINIVEELVNMIQTQRAYEMNSKSISTTDQMLARITQL